MRIAPSRVFHGPLLVTFGCACCTQFLAGCSSPVRSAPPEETRVLATTPVTGSVFTERSENRTPSEEEILKWAREEVAHRIAREKEREALQARLTEEDRKRAETQRKDGERVSTAPPTVSAPSTARLVLKTRHEVNTPKGFLALDEGVVLDDAVVKGQMVITEVAGYVVEIPLAKTRPSGPPEPVVNVADAGYGWGHSDVYIGIKMGSLTPGIPTRIALDQRTEERFRVFIGTEEGRTSIRASGYQAVHTLWSEHYKLGFAAAMKKAMEEMAHATAPAF